MLPQRLSRHSPVDPLVFSLQPSELGGDDSRSSNPLGLWHFVATVHNNKKLLKLNILNSKCGAWVGGP